jgi:hypothetical protein
MEFKIFLNDLPAEDASVCALEKVAEPGDVRLQVFHEQTELVPLEVGAHLEKESPK